MARPSTRHNKNNKPTNKNSTMKVNKTRKQTRRRKAASDDDESESEAYVDEDSDAGSILSIDSDAIDESDFETAAKGGKRKRASTKNGSPKKMKPATKKPRNSKSTDEDEEFDDLEDGQEVVGTVVQAPKTGRGIFIHNVILWEKSRHLRVLSVVQFPQDRYPKILSTSSSNCRTQSAMIEPGIMFNICLLIR